MTNHSGGGQTRESRRTFIRKVGKSILAVSVVDIIMFADPKLALACGESTSDATCGTSYSPDENCHVNNDPDNNCGALPQQSADANCGHPSSGGAPTGGPSGTDMDEACTPAVSDSDENCSIGQVPNAAHDVDESCNATGSDSDQSCGDCNDNHQTDDHCNVGGDPDDLCGHQHLYWHIHEDAACSATVADVGCGQHSTNYGGSVNDPDQHCVESNTDMNCSSHPTTDANCNAAANPSTTSPDEHCSATDLDQACSLYDKDESCNSSSVNAVDEGCGVTKVEGWWDYTDPDDHCGIDDDPDDSEGEACPIGGG